MKNPFFFEAEVLQGDKRGRTIGFPTINQKYPEDLVKVKFGVYKTKVIADGKAYDGITNIGLRPTFESEYIISETFIKDFSGDLYGKTVKIVLEEFIRPEVKFGSLEELKQQIEKDINYIK
jgi:riboflavin kinase/FMN adenylyltransferase